MFPVNQTNRFHFARNKFCYVLFRCFDPFSLGSKSDQGHWERHFYFAARSLLPACSPLNSMIHSNSFWFCNIIFLLYIVSNNYKLAGKFNLSVSLSNEMNIISLQYAHANEMDCLFRYFFVVSTKLCSAFI